MVWFIVKDHDLFCESYYGYVNSSFYSFILRNKYRNASTAKRGCEGYAKAAKYSSRCSICTIFDSIYLNIDCCALNIEH